MSTAPEPDERPWYEDPYRYHLAVDAAARRVIATGGWPVRFAPFLVPVGLLVLASVESLYPFNDFMGFAGFAAIVGAIVWHYTRRNRVARRIIRQRLCFGCGYALVNAVTDDVGAGVCPECGRAYLVRHYRPPVIGYQKHDLDDVIVDRIDDDGSA